MGEIDLTNLFTDSELVAKIKEKLPKLFRMAEIETSRAGKIGKEVALLERKL